ncbi:MAG: glycosyltransferase family 39 protein [Chloroflexi bacterium]|nr:glycosyltransferase family 39 protein [Chloroflexota bacterium]
MKLLSKPLLLKLYLFISALESAVVFYLLISIPSDIKNVVFFGYSIQRLLLLAWIFIVFFLFVMFFVRINISDDFLNITIVFVENVFNVRWQYFFLYFFSLVLMAFGGVVLLAPREGSASYLAYLERLAPMIYLGSWIGMQTLLGQFFWRGQKINWHVFFEWKALLIVTSIGFGGILVFSLWVAWSGIGLIPETYGWHSPGTPIIFYQLILAWLVVLPFIIWDNPIATQRVVSSKKYSFNIRLDTIVCLVLWLVAALVWWGEPVRKDSYFTPAPTPPNFEYYPHSDAAIYDLSAQNILIGADQNNKIILRPLYVFFLALLHVIGGQKYENVVFFQILFLAVIPVLAYLLGSMLGGRPAALLTAILMILREKNSITLTNVIEVSHSKLLLSDVPMMALVVLMVYVLIKWLKEPSSTGYLGIFAGAAYGLVMLVRSHQAQVIIPALLIGMAFSGGFQFKRIFQRVLMFGLGFVIIVAPWIWRNYEVNGKPEIESSEFYISWYAGAYTEPTDTVDILPGESPDDYSSRIKHQVVQYILDHPAELARVYTSYFIRNEIDSVIYLPMSIKLYDLRLYLSRMQFWKLPQLNFTIGSGLIFFTTLGLIVFGVSLAVQRLGFLGLLPLLIHFSYNFSMSLARISGWRFVQPVDWIMQLYYCIGLVALTVIVISLLSNKLSTVIDHAKADEEAGNIPLGGVTRQQLLLVFCLFLGLSFPLTEMLIPERYPETGADQMIARYAAGGVLDSESGITASDLRSFLQSDPTAVILSGRALYPAFYEQGKFWGDNNAFSFRARNFDRLQFIYIGTETTPVFIPMALPPQYFPNTANVIILGCREEAAIRALAIKVNDQASFIINSPWQGLTCSTQ